MVSKCEDILDNEYDAQACRYDPIDMTVNTLRHQTICTELAETIQTLQQYNMDSEAYLLKYSYIISLSSYIEAKEIQDFGRCTEQEALVSSFCTTFFNWDLDFPLFAESQYVSICEEVYNNIIGTQTLDYCAYYASRIWQTYDSYTDIIVQDLVDQVYDYFSYQFNEVEWTKSDTISEIQQNQEQKGAYMDLQAEIVAECLTAFAEIYD